MTSDGQSPRGLLAHPLPPPLCPLQPRRASPPSPRAGSDLGNFTYQGRCFPVIPHCPPLRSPTVTLTPGFGSGYKGPNPCLAVPWGGSRGKVQARPVAGAAPGTRGALSKWHLSCLSPWNLGLLAQRLECGAPRPILKPRSWKGNVNSHPSDRAPNPPPPTVRGTEDLRESSVHRSAAGGAARDISGGKGWPRADGQVAGAESELKLTSHEFSQHWCRVILFFPCRCPCTGVGFDGFLWHQRVKTGNLSLMPGRKDLLCFLLVPPPLP